MRDRYRPPSPILIAVAALMMVVVGAIPGMIRAEQKPAATAALAINDFGLHLLRTLSAGHETQNTIISPVSVALALAMTYNGAAGNTYLAMGQALQIATMGDSVNPLNRSLLETIKTADPSLQIAIANALWAQKGFKLDHGFVTALRTYYQARVRRLDFESNPDSAAGAINQWVDRATRGKIPTIVDKLSPLTQMVLTDAVYFKGKWTWPFPKEATAPRDFYVAEANVVKMPMMRLERDFEYLENDDFQAVRLPYGNQRFAMYVLLPRKRDGLANLAGELSESKWRQWQTQFVTRKGTVVLPKFKLTYKAKLNDALKQMGMSVAFSADADFSRIHTPPPPPPPLEITDVEHRTFIKVEETGTEAAAATSVTVALAAVMPKEPPPFEMVVDHPFFFAITERESGAMLFAGIVMNPSAE
jgi:serine protease inhibitor